MKSANPELPLAAPGGSPSTELVTGKEPTVGQLLQHVIEKGDPVANIEVLERLIALKERSDAKQAEREFAVAFAKLQREIGSVEAKKEVPNRDGSIRYIYAPFEDIMRHVQPFLEANGFSVTFSSEIKEDRVVLHCTIRHTAGHSQTNQFMARIGSGPPNASGAQADGAAATYAKRRAFCDALNIVAEVDTDGADQDARSLGAPISHEQAQTLRELVKETRSNEAAFLKYAGAATYEEIGQKRYQELFRTLQHKLRPV
jgi:hypothetical protein